jgi:Phage tail tube protein, TTP
MAVRLPNGSILAIATGYGTADVMSALTNADPGVATVTSANTTGDELEVTSGWPKMNGRIVVAGTVSGVTTPLTGVDTTSTTLYPAGGGIGSVRKITGWQQISQVLTLTSSGGDQQFATYDFLETDDEYQIPTRRSASSLALSIGDDITLPHYAYLDAADQDRQPRALRLTLPSGSKIYYNVYVSLNRTPSLTQDQIMALAVSFSQLAPATRY